MESPGFHAFFMPFSLNHMNPIPDLEILLEVRGALESVLERNTVRLVTDGSLTVSVRERIARAVAHTADALEELHRLIAERTKP